MNMLILDVRHAARSLRKRPGFAAITVLTLALGVGAVTAVSTVVKGVLLQDLPYPEPNRLMLLWVGTSEDPDRRGPVSPPVLLDLREAAASFSAIAGMNSFSTTFISDDGQPQQIDLGVISGDVFGVLGTEAALGRVLVPDDDRPLNTRDPAAVGLIVLDHAFWKLHLGGDEDIVGRTIQVGGGNMQVVGVLREGFRLRMPPGAGMTTDFAGWTPLGIDYAAADREGAYLRIIARLRDGVSVGQAQAELDVVAARMRDSFQPHAASGLRFRVTPMQRDVVAHVRPTLVLLFISGFIVLFVACVNAASLLLVSFMGRWREFAIRTAVGAARSRLVRQLLVSALLLTFAGTALGVATADPIIRLLLAIEPGVIPHARDIGVDAGIWLIAAVLAVFIAIASGIGPALYLTRTASLGPLGSRESASPGMRRQRRVLVAAQVAAAFALLYSSIILLDALVRAERADLGFQAAGVQTFRVTLPFARYQGPDAWIPFFEEFRRRLELAGEIHAVGMGSELPLSGSSPEPYAPADLAATPVSGTRNAVHHIVTPGYFDAMGIAMHQGRDFTDADREGAAPVAIIDTTLAARLRSEREVPVLGRRLDVTAHGFRDGYSVGSRTVEIVGVVETVTHEHPEVASPGALYMPHAQHPLWTMSVVLRGAPDALEAGRTVLKDFDDQLPAVGAGPLSGIVREVLAPTRFLLSLTAVFAFVTILLTISGLYGLVAETVRQDRKSLGVRAAVGATRGALLRHVMTRGMLLVLAGLLLGAGLAPVASGMIERAVTITGGMNFMALAVSGAMLLFAALAASFVPAQAASRIDPVRALREE